MDAQLYILPDPPASANYHVQPQPHGFDEPPAVSVDDVEWSDILSTIEQRCDCIEAAMAPMRDWIGRHLIRSTEVYNDALEEQLDDLQKRVDMLMDDCAQMFSRRHPLSPHYHARSVSLFLELCHIRRSTSVHAFTARFPALYALGRHFAQAMEIRDTNALIAAEKQRWGIE